MKKIYSDRIVNIEGTDKFDSIFSIDMLDWETLDQNNSNIEVIFMSDLLEKRKNNEILKKVKEKPAMYSNIYSPEDELELFEELFNNEKNNKKRIHIV